MKKVLFTVATLALFGILAAFNIPSKDTPATSAAPAAEIKWYTWEEAIELNKKEPRKLFIDVYTDWCGWCKRMDATTFKDPKVVEHMNAKYYPIKLDAEQKEDVLYNNHTFKYIANAGRRGIHELAYSLLDGQMSYPSYVYLTENVERIYVSKGFKETEPFLKELDYFTNEKYLESNQ